MLTAELLTALLALAAGGATLLYFTPPEERGAIWFCLAATLPMSWLMFHEVRLPLDRWLASALGPGPLLNGLRTAYAPLTEEPAKLWPLLIPTVRRSVTAKNLPRFALALGLGFGLGEIFTVGGLVASGAPQVAALPWYLLDGFIMERLLTCIVHPGLVALTLAGWRRAGSLFLGLSFAMLAHYLTNLPIALAQHGWLGANAALSQAVLSLWIVGCAGAALAWLGVLSSPEFQPGCWIYGRAICPECGREYARGLFSGLNLGVDRRYERCPFCRHWHWTHRSKGRLA